jgi:hypothetical protein
LARVARGLYGGGGDESTEEPHHHQGGETRPDQRRFALLPGALRDVRVVLVE